jgi:hypothetical protein
LGSHFVCRSSSAVFLSPEMESDLWPRIAQGPG